jgi:hypothetical protein
MRVTIRGIEFKFWFKHTKTSTIVNCTFGSPEPVYRSSALLAKSDTFCKATGRKVALTRLLRVGLLRYQGSIRGTDWAFSREERKLIWAEYFKQHADLKK